MLTVERKKIYKNTYNSNKFWVDIITLLPLNLFIWGIWGDDMTGGFERIIVDILRSLRIMSCYKLTNILH